MFQLNLHSYAIVWVLFLCYCMNMKNILSNSKKYLNSYDNEAFAPQDFNCCKIEEKCKITISDTIKRVKFEAIKGDKNVQLLQP